MANRIVESQRFQTVALRTKPVAVISPADTVKVIGAIINLDGRGSYSEDGEDITYSWAIVSEYDEATGETKYHTPIGSTVTDVRSVEGDDSVVTITPDLTGQYEVGLTVSTPYATSDQVVAKVFIQASLVPVRPRLTPDGTFMYKVLSDFWGKVNDREAFSVLWSGYTQMAACDLLRILQIEYGNSIARIQPLYRRRWLGFSPRLDLDPTLAFLLTGSHQGGSTAFTGGTSFINTGIVISPEEIIIREGSVVPQAIGTSLSIFSGANPGTYMINRMNAGEDGYIVSAATIFPAPGSDIATSGADLITVAVSDEVSSATVDFVAASVLVGDVLRIDEGQDTGYYEVLAVGVAGGLTTDRHIKIDANLGTTESSLDFRVFSKIRASFQVADTAFTDVVYIPKDDADLSVYESVTFSGSQASIVSPTEILVDSRHVLPSLVGSTIALLSGPVGVAGGASLSGGDIGESFTIGSVNDAGTGFHTTSSFSTETFPVEGISYEIPSVTTVTDYLLILDGRAHKISSAVLDEELPSLLEGGRGPLWVIRLESPTAPNGKEGLVWKVVSTVQTSEYEDMEDMGVQANDLLYLKVQRQDTLAEALVPLTVLGAAENLIGVELGTYGTGTLDGEQIYDLAVSLVIPGVFKTSSYANTDTPEDLQIEVGSVLLAYPANDIKTDLDASFVQENSGIPIESTTKLSIYGLFDVNISVSHVVRNSRIPSQNDSNEEPILSVPILYEHIRDTVVGDLDGQKILVGLDLSATPIDRDPLVLVENTDFTTGPEDNVVGYNAETTSGSAIIKIPYGDLIDRDVKYGDSIDLTSGYDQIRFDIIEVVDSENLRVLSTATTLPTTTDTGLSFKIIRRTPGRFMRMVGQFTPTNPAPDSLWAQNVYYDGSLYVEDNFGVLVGLTRKQLEEYGSPQSTYRGAVSGLMYAWTRGPIVDSVSIGTHILLDMAVTETLGRIVDIDHEYSEERGKVQVEDIDTELNPTGLVRVYYFTRDTVDTLPEFRGLGVNPDTGATYALSDIVPPFRHLSKSVKVSDIKNDPKWWDAAANATGGDELQKYHTWQLLMDAASVDSRDIPLVSDFVTAITPAYTKPKLVLLRFLSDDITVTDELFMDMTFFFYDDPSFGIEMTHMVDSFNRTGVPHRMFRFPSVGTRSMFKGWDLVTTAGGTSVTSARGGFVEALSAADGINPYFDGTAAKVDGSPATAYNYIGDEDDPGDDILIEFSTRGVKLVRPGDILYIESGVNRARFIVEEVISDTELRISTPNDPHEPGVPRALPMDQVQSGVEQKFHIFRQDKNPIVSGTLESATATAAYDAEGNFQWDGVASGDFLVITEGSAIGRYRITDLGEWDDPSDSFTNIATKLTLEDGTDISAVSADNYIIEREALLQNPIAIWENAGLSTSGITNAATLSPLVGLGFSLRGVRLGDKVTVTDDPSGALTGEVYTVVTAVSDTSLRLDRVLPAFPGSTGCTIRIDRPTVVDDDDISGTTHRDSDATLERLMAEDYLELEVLAPTVVVTLDLLPTLNFVIRGSTLTSTTDLEAAIAATSYSASDLRVELGRSEPIGAADYAPVVTLAGGIASSGVYQVASVSGGVFTLGANLPDEDVETHGVVLAEDITWFELNVSYRKVEANPAGAGAGFSFLGAGVRPGDVFVFGGGWAGVDGLVEEAVITRVTASECRFGVSISTTVTGDFIGGGRIVRRVRS